MAALPFTKLHALGNDFVLLDVRANGIAPSKAAIRALAVRKRGVGFDQLLVLRGSARVHAKLEIYNADASTAEMCGNGLRAAALYLWTRGRMKDQDLVLETAAGDRRARALGPITPEDSGGTIECEMGIPKVRYASGAGSAALPPALRRGICLGGRVYHPVCVDVGNPHAVLFVTPRHEAQLAEWGQLVENHRAFPRRTNVEFVRVRDRHVIEVKVWERGVGITEACGTGAVAAACAAITLGRAASPVEVRFPGGEAEVRWEAGSRKTMAYLRGHAREVFTGTLDL